jgi:hypothetical protein
MRLPALTLHASFLPLPEDHLLAVTSKELGVFGLELVADVIHLARRHRLLQNQGYGPGVADGLVLADAALFLADSPVELVQREVVPPALASQRRRELIRELGGEVIRLVTRQPL